jgi:predicted metalloprotease with PDZ domain
MNDEGFARTIGGAVNAVVNGGGRRYSSAVEMSRQAPFVDAAQSIDPQNRANTFISYYTWGEVIAVGLDLTLRSRFSNLTLDDFMRAMWVKFGKTETPYTLEDVRTTLGEVTRDPAFANEYFNRYIAGRDVPDYAALFATVGFFYRPARPGVAWLGDGAFTVNQWGGITLSTPAPVGTPLYAAGLERGDVIRTLDRQAVTTNPAIDSVLARHKPGDTVEVSFESRGVPVKSRLVLVENPRMELVPAESAGVTVSPGALEARRRWLASRAGAAGAPR